MANDPGAPAQPPWLQGYRDPRGGADDPLLPNGHFVEHDVQPDTVAGRDVADRTHHDIDDQVNHDRSQQFSLPLHNGWSTWTSERQDWPDDPDEGVGPPQRATQVDPVEARAVELMRLLEQASSAPPAIERREPGRHRADPEPQQRLQPPLPQRVPPQQPPPPPPSRPSARVQHREPVRPLDEAAVANPGRFAPKSGWRRAIYRASAGRVNPGDSAKVRNRDELFAKIRQPIRGDFRIAVLSIKGGVGKTTTTLGLGSTFATIRTDRVIAVDANPDRGTLAQRVDDPSEATVQDLLSDPNLQRYSDVRYHTRMADSRLEVLGSPLDPAISEAFGEADYRRTMDILKTYYNIILTDCGTGIMHSAMAGVLDLAHAVVVVSSPALDAARSASATLDWLMNHGYAGLVRESHLVLSAARPGESAVRMDKVYEHFESRCRSVHLIPFDSHLAEGAEVDMELLKPATVQAYIELAGAVAEKFARLRPDTGTP